MISNKTSQLLLIKFPIIFPIFYGLTLYYFPTYEKELILITILLLAETHFGATWPFFLNKVNHQYLKEKKLNLIYIPVLILTLCIIGYVYFKNLFLLIFFAANVYHVTRQSWGICKLYCKDENEFKFQSNFIYLINFLLFSVALFRFYAPIIKTEHLLFLNLLFGAIMLSVSIFYILKFRFSENYLTFLTGSLIFYPACFVNNPVHVILMGVTMHFTQYLYLTNFVSKSRASELDINERKDKNYFFSFFIIILIYSSIMTLFSSSGGTNGILFKDLILIPIIGQMLHFYIDSQVWKFSEKNNRENVLRHLQKIIN